MISRVVGYCPRAKCHKPFAWHKNELTFSRGRGCEVVVHCSRGHAFTGERCAECGEIPEVTCVYTDDSQPGYAWGLASQLPAREYATGARISEERCGFVNPAFPGLPCQRDRGHDESPDVYERTHDAPLEDFPLEYVLRFVQRPPQDQETGLFVNRVRRKTREGVRDGLFDFEGRLLRAECEHCQAELFVTDRSCSRCGREREAKDLNAQR